MENILYNISQVLGITIIHSLWQGLLVYFMLRLALMFAGRVESSTKYWLAVSSLVAITGWFIYTLVNEINIYNWLAVVPAKLSAAPILLNLPAGISQFNDQSIRYYYSIEGYLPYITLLYITGLLFNSGRLVLARKKINAIKQTMSIDIALQHAVNKFSTTLNISSKVKIGLSKLIDVPCMVGYFKPVILLPFTLSSYLSTEEIEAILLHELAHIKRNDYLVNLLQQVISIILFFNPCTLLINRLINEERENCCDDLVISATASPLIYAKALFKLEQTRENDFRLAMAATGKKYQLLNRIERIMKTKKTTPSLRPALLATLILTIGTALVTLLNPEIAEGKISVKAISPVISNLLTDTVHKTATKSTVHVQKHVTKKVYHTSHSVTNAQQGDDKKLEALSADVQKHSEALNKYYNSETFKTTQRQLEEKGKEMQEFYGRPELKRLQEELSQAGGEFSKNYGNNDKLNDLTAQMGEKGKKIGAYYSTPEFKKLNNSLKKKYGIPEEMNYGDDRDENYKKYQAELDTHIPADIKLQQKELEEMGKQVSARYETPEFKAQNKRMQVLGDSLNKAYANPQIKEQQKEMDQLAKQMNTYQNNPDIKKEQALLNQAVSKLNAYINSPDYRKYISQLKKMSFSYNFNYNDDVEKPEAPEAPEAPEVTAPVIPVAPAVLPVIPVAPPVPPVAPAAPVN